MNRLGTVARTHAVDLDDDKAQLGHRLLAMECGKGFWDERALRAGVNVLDDRVLSGGVEIAWPIDDAIDVGGAVAALGGEALGESNVRRR